MSDTEHSLSDSDISEPTYNQSRWLRQRNEDRENLRSLRETHLEALDNLFEEIENQERRAVLTKNQLRVRKERLRNHFKAMEQAHVLYKQVCLLASNDIYEATEVRYMEATAAIDDRIDEIRRTENAQLEQNGFQRGEMSANSSMFPAGQQVIRVENARPPQVGTFNGDPAAWPAFRDLFIAEVHNKEMDDVNKLLLLQTACVDKAATTLGPWQPTGDNYLPAWEVLMAAYNDEYHVMHGILGKLFSIPRQEREDHGSLNMVYQTITNSMRQLRTIRPSSDAILDQMCIHIAKRRLPKQTLDSWEQQRNRKDDNVLPSCSEFLKFLETKSKGRREFEYEGDAAKSSSSGKQRTETRSTRFKPYDANSSRDKSYQRPKTESSGTPRPTSCVVSGCKEMHPLWRCEAFMKMPLLDRVETMKSNRLCRCCLSPGHMSFACARSGCSKCPEAKFKHHIKLCPKTADAKQNALLVKRQDASSSQ